MDDICFINSLGSFRMGRMGTPVIIFSVIYSAQGMFLPFWPPDSTVTAESMNWPVVVYIGTMAVSMGFWMTHGRKVYKSPLVEVSVPVG